MKKSCILMVEDEPAMLKMNAEYFEGQGYTVTAAATLAEARAALHDSPPDLVLLDVMLPDGSGFDFCREVRQLSAAPVIFLTALGDSTDEEQGFALGGDDYVVKPYQISVLAARVTALLRRAGAISWGRLEIPPLSVDTRVGRCLLDGRQINLSQMELRLLYFMMENFGKRLHRDAIYESVWGTSAQSNSHTVREHIYRLRKKLDMSSPDSYFQITSEDKEYLFGKVRY